MSMFLIQTLLSLLAAYFIGAWLGCLMRRTFAPLPAETGVPRLSEALAANEATGAAVAAPVRRPDPIPAGDPRRFERALQGTEPAAPPVASPVEPARPMITPAAPAPATAAAPISSAAAAAATAPTHAPAAAAAGPAAVDVPREVRQSTPGAMIAPAAAAASGAAAAAVAAGIAAMAASRSDAGGDAASAPARTAPSAATETARAADGIVAAAKAAATTTIMPIAGGSATGQSSVAATMAVAPAAAMDDLTRIRSIDAALASRIHQAGIRRYADLAGLKAADVAALSATLGIKGQIEQENWIEQAEILAKGGETLYARRMAEARAPQIATPPPHEGLPRPLAPAGATAAPTAAEPVRPKAPAETQTAPRVEERAAFVAPVASTPPAAAADAVRPVTVPSAPSTAPVAPAALASRDALQRIAGINESVERLLNVQGIGRYAQIAGWTAEDVTRFDRLLGRDGRVRAENWIEQAQILARGGETAFSREFDRNAMARSAPAKETQPAAVAPAPQMVVPGATGARPKGPDEQQPATVVTPAMADPPRPARLIDAIRDKKGDMPSTAGAQRGDLSSLRSVRSEAYKTVDSIGATAVAAAAAAGMAGMRTIRSTGGDDLKRIRGIGVLIEKKLNSMGYSTYAQIAAWTPEDVGKVSAMLDFKGRIERENWIEQARILSSGGQTEFSRRVDRGEVETSRSRE